MKTLSDFFSNDQNVQVLSVSELVSVRGGDNPPTRPSDPFKRVKPTKSRKFYRL